MPDKIILSLNDVGELKLLHGKNDALSSNLCFSTLTLGRCSLNIILNIY